MYLYGMIRALPFRRSLKGGRVIGSNVFVSDEISGIWWELERPEGYWQ